MYNRPLIKEQARWLLNQSWGNMILVALIAGLIVGDVSFSSGLRVNINLGQTDRETIFFLLPIVLSLSGLFLLYNIFVGAIIANGTCGWYLRHWYGQRLSVSEMFASFRIYKPVLLTTLLRRVLTFLWTLLLIIPGIIKGYAYSMADYIIYENPNLPAGQALKLSERITDGHKFDLFVLELSFLGWNLLAAITCGIVGILYVNPYYYTAHAGTYYSLKEEAILAGRATWADFGQMPPAPPAPPAPPVYPTQPPYTPGM